MQTFQEEEEKLTFYERGHWIKNAAACLADSSLIKYIDNWMKVYLINGLIDLFRRFPYP